MLSDIFTHHSFFETCIIRVRKHSIYFTTAAWETLYLVMALSVGTAEFVLVFHFAAGTCTVVVVVVCLFVSYHDYVPQNSIHIQCL